jgi:hypothetical protein
MTLRLDNLSSLASLAFLARLAAHHGVLRGGFESGRAEALFGSDGTRFFCHLILKTGEDIWQCAVCFLRRAPEVLGTELARVYAGRPEVAGLANSEGDVGRVGIEGHEMRVEERRGHPGLVLVQEHAHVGLR